jgi:hypothetical protein
MRIGMAGRYLGANAALWIPAAFALVFGLLANRRGGGARVDRPAVLGLVFSLPLWLGLILGGGDHMPGIRMIVPPLVLLAFAVGLDRASLAGARAPSPEGPGGPTSSDHSRKLFSWLRRPFDGMRPMERVWVVLVLLTVVWQARCTFAVPWKRDTAAELGKLIGRYLESNVPPGALIAASTAGSTPFHAPDLRFLDMLGLNDPHIARREVTRITTRWQNRPGHLKGDGAYVLGRRPDLVILGPSQGFLGVDPKDWFLSDYELLQSPEFRSLYAPYLFLVPVGEEMARDPAIKPVLARSGTQLLLVVYLRQDSGLANRFSTAGRRLNPPGNEQGGPGSPPP